MREGARDCLRRGDLRRIKAAVERETTAVVDRRARADADSGDRYQRADPGDPGPDLCGVCRRQR